MAKSSASQPVAPPSLYPFDFSPLREGDTDPVLGKTIKWLIDSDNDYIVYIDDDDYVQWTMNDNRMLANASDLLTRVGWLEAAEVDHLEQWQIETYKRLIGEGVARLFDGDQKAATAALDAAERWITARNQESARVWYLEGAAVGFAAIAIGYLVIARWYAFDVNTLVQRRA